MLKNNGNTGWQGSEICPKSDHTTSIAMKYVLKSIGTPSKSPLDPITPEQLSLNRLSSLPEIFITGTQVADVTPNSN